MKMIQKPFTAPPIRHQYGKRFFRERGDTNPPGHFGKSAGKRARLSLRRHIGLYNGLGAESILSGRSLQRQHQSHAHIRYII